MKKLSILALAVILTSACAAFAATYKVNTSGTVKSPTGQIMAAPGNTINQNYYNNYQAQTYVANNQVNATQVGTIEIVMDYSGSMSNWIGVAKRSMAAIISQIPPTTRVGFRVFGYDYDGNNPPLTNTVQQVKKIVKKGNGRFSVVTTSGALGSTTGACAATRQVTSISAANSDALLRGMNSVNIGGVTPLVYALDRTVYQDFVGMDMTSPKKIVLITDGGENCNGDPCAFARQLMQRRSDVHIDVVLVSSNSRGLSCLASTTGGHFYTINNLSDFSTVMNQSLQSLPSSVPEVQQPTQNYEFIKDENDLYQ